MKANISYEKDIRVEKYPFPRDGVREVIYNALIHCNWADCTPIQIRIEEDAMYISNSCILPSDWTVATLMQRHKSKPYNPDIANTFFRAGYVEIWGRGIQKICEACDSYGISNPEFEVLGGDLTVKMTALNYSTQLTTQSTTQSSKIDKKIIDLISISPTLSQRKIAEEIGETYNTVRYHMEAMIKSGTLIQHREGRSSCWEILQN